MPDNFDDEQIENMSIDEINELFEDVIEMPDEYRISGPQCLGSRVKDVVFYIK